MGTEEKNEERKRGRCRFRFGMIAIILALAIVSTVLTVVFGKICDGQLIAKFFAIYLSLASLGLFVFLFYMVLRATSKERKGWGSHPLWSAYEDIELDEIKFDGKSIEENVEYLKNNFGKESFFYKQYYEKIKKSDTEEQKKERKDGIKRLQNALLKTRRRFVSTFFYLFVFNILLYGVLLVKTFADESIRHNTDKDYVATKSVYATAHAGESGKNRIENGRLYVFDDSIKLSLWLHVKRSFMSEDVYIMDSVYVKTPKESIYGNKVKIPVLIGKYICIKEEKTKDGDVRYVSLDKNRAISGVRYDLLEDKTVVYATEIIKKRIVDTIKGRRKIVDINSKGKIIKINSKGEIVDIKEREKELYRLHIKTLGNCIIPPFDYEIHKEKDVYDFIFNVLNMLTNVFLLMLFGMMQTKTDVFDEEHNTDNYSLIKIISTSLFVIICALDALLTFAWIGGPTTHFVISTVIAIVSVIAIFGVWGSLSNSYTNFSGAFKFFVFLYAVSQILSIFLEIDGEDISSKLSLFLLFVAFLGKLLIMFKIPDLLADGKLSKYFLHEANEARSCDNSYGSFVKLFNPRRIIIKK